MFSALILLVTVDSVVPVLPRSCNECVERIDDRQVHLYVLFAHWFSKKTDVVERFTTTGGVGLLESFILKMLASPLLCSVIPYDRQQIKNAETK